MALLNRKRLRYLLSAWFYAVVHAELRPDDARQVQEWSRQKTTACLDRLRERGDIRRRRR